MTTIPEWSTRIFCNTSEVEGSFSAFVFLGNVPTDPSQWLNDPAFAGVFDVYAYRSADEGGSIIHGFVHLNQPLSDRGVSIRNEKEVQTFLKSRLNWAVQRGLDGASVNLDKIPSLEVTILCTPRTYPVGGKYPIEGKPTFYNDITRGKPGGYKGIYDNQVPASAPTPVESADVRNASAPDGLGIRGGGHGGLGFI